MLNRGVRISLLVAVIGVMGCTTTHRAPRFQESMVIPTVLNPGNSGLIRVELWDRYNIVHKVEGRLREDDRIVFSLNDLGEQGDATAGDEFWSLQIDVPFNAPPGAYTLDVYGFGSSGDPILVKDDEGTVQPLSTSLDVVIAYEEPMDEEEPSEES